MTLAEKYTDAGYSDDLGALAGALGLVSLYINDEVKQRARQTLARWFGPVKGKS
ncbi:hypothetical protein [Halopseudomonas pelagia]|uniref:hypothetical protein n=1 Tax=Halopseudomonas pelagia TaxID=553151 RepID=UPI001293095B|nr:hypothetical protein [Halopseudomonas pelagia]